MNRERFLKTEQLFNDALAQTIDRDGWVTRACGSDTELQDELRALLAEHENLAALPNEPELLPKFGVWQALRVLGRGGMGTVYLSDRADGAFQMQAAVKVVPLALASSEIEARFRREREFLAGLEHPGITRLIDGGVSELGMPYLVMEFVEGVAIDRYCIDGNLPARARVELVRQVLAALAYVHAQKVIHRDLKPSNVLVNAGGRAKLLDFGIARLAEVGAGADLTRTGLAAFTPDYASPEQLRGGIASYRSDLYSVGVLFYRVLTGRLPAKRRYLPLVAEGPSTPFWKRRWLKTLRIATNRLKGSMPISYVTWKGNPSPRARIDVGLGWPSRSLQRRRLSFGISTGLSASRCLPAPTSGWPGNRTARV